MANENPPKAKPNPYSNAKDMWCVHLIYILHPQEETALKRLALESDSLVLVKDGIN